MGGAWRCGWRVAVGRRSCFCREPARSGLDYLNLFRRVAAAGVTVRTVRHYHQVGLLPEPERDASGYRRYGARAVIDLIRIRTLAAAGVPLSRVDELLHAAPAEFAAAVDGIDRDLRRQIGEPAEHRKRIRSLAAGDQLFLPPEIVAILGRRAAAGRRAGRPGGADVRARDHRLPRVAAHPPPSCPNVVIVTRAAEPTPDQPVTRSTLLDVAVRKNTTRVEVREIRILAGTEPGLHVHNGPVFGSVLSGSVIYQIEGEPSTVLRAGDVFYEPEGVRIARFDATDEGVTFLAYYLLAEGEDAEITFPER
jgi:DNA-binding transcriptional MerR regulator/quercetin dioxygenase-like cupin family protein